MEANWTALVAPLIRARETMNKILNALLALVPVTASPAVAQQPTLIVENGRVNIGDGTVLEEA